MSSDNDDDDDVVDDIHNYSSCLSDSFQLKCIYTISVFISRASIKLEIEYNFMV